MEGPTAPTAQQGEGSDRHQVTAGDVASWSVPDDQPRTLYIEKLGIGARIKRMGINPDNSLQAPENIWDVGWYGDSAKPGQDGATLIDGHAGFGAPALLNSLQRLVPGDRLVIEDGARNRHNYRVVRAEVVDRENVDMSAMLRPVGGSRGLNLITCAGAWDSNAATSTERVLVFAVAAR